MRSEVEEVEEVEGNKADEPKKKKPVHKEAKNKVRSQLSFIFSVFFFCTFIFFKKNPSFYNGPLVERLNFPNEKMQYTSIRTY